MDLFTDKLIPGLGVYNGQEIIKHADLLKYVTIVAYVVTQTLKDSSDISKGIESTIKAIPYIPCPQVDPEIISSKIKEDDNTKLYYERYGLCPDIKDYKDWVIQGSLDETPFKYIRISVYPCTLTTPASNCVSHTEITKSKLKLGILETTYDLSNKNDPLGEVVNFDSEYFLNPGQLNHMTYFYQNNQILDDRSDFGDEKLNSRYLDREKTITSSGYRDNTVSCPLANIGTLFCREYLVLEFRSGNKIKQIQRRYRKYLETFGDVGGYIEMILIICRVVYLCYNRHFYKRYIRREIVGFESQDIQRMVPDSSKKEIRKGVDKIVRDNFDAIGLFRNVNNLEVLEKLLFKNYHITLLPIVLI